MSEAASVIAFVAMYVSLQIWTSVTCAGPVDLLGTSHCMHGVCIIAKQHCAYHLCYLSLTLVHVKEIMMMRCLAKAILITCMRTISSTNVDIDTSEVAPWTEVGSSCRS